MTLSEIHNQIRIQFEALAAQTLDNFLPQEIDLYINKAIREYIEKNRPVLLQDEEPSRSAEAVEKVLRTLLFSHLYSEGDFSSMSVANGGFKLPLSDPAPEYEYFITGRLETDKDIYNAETVSVKNFYEHLETRHNLPLFRRPKVVGRGNELLVSIPDPDESPTGLEMTYLGKFSRVDIELNIEYEFSSSGNTGDSEIIIEGVSYPISFDTDASTTVDSFLSTHKADIRARHDVIAQDLGSSVGMKTFNSDISESDFDYDASGSVSFIQSTVTSRPDLPLPPVSHQDIVNLTVRLMRRDLPQAQNPEPTPQQERQIRQQQQANQE